MNIQAIKAALSVMNESYRVGSTMHIHLTSGRCYALPYDEAIDCVVSDCDRLVVAEDGAMTMYIDADSVVSIDIIAPERKS